MTRIKKALKGEATENRCEKKRGGRHRVQKVRFNERGRLEGAFPDWTSRSKKSVARLQLLV